MAARVPSRPRNAQNKLSNENAVSKHIRHPSNSATTGPSRVPIKSSATRSALSELTKLSQNRKPAPKRVLGPKGIPEEKPVVVETTLKRSRSSSLAAALGPQRVPLGPGRAQPAPSILSTTIARVQPPTRSFRIPVFTSNKSQPSPPAPAPAPEDEPQSDDVDDRAQSSLSNVPHSDDMDIEVDVPEPQPVKAVKAAVDNVMSPPPEQVVDEMLAELEDEHEMLDSEDGSQLDHDDEDHDNELRGKALAEWPDMSSKFMLRQRARVDEIRECFVEEVDVLDPTMVSEYAEEIFDYMEELEEEMMPNPSYMSQQTDITWSMRQTLVDWLLQVHIRYHMLPETLWIAVNIIDRFLSKRIVSLVKLQLVGVTAMFIASKYEEILAPSIDEFVFMTGNGYTKAEILKGERIVLSTVEFRVSSYCSPYSWMRRISKADDYDLQTRTLGKFLSEVMLVDWRFLAVKPSLIAAVSMYAARRMLGNDWNESFVFYSGFTEEQVGPGYDMLVEKLREPGFEKLYVCKKYAHKKFLKASVFAVEWAGGNFGACGEDEI